MSNAAVQSASLRVLGLIPARGGSKGIPRKNVKHLCGQPLISYTLETACAAQSLARVAVTSDDDEILECARGFDGVIAIERPAELSTDQASVVPALKHALDILDSSHAEQFDAVALLQPTSPLREPRHINEAIQLLADQREAQSIISVTAMSDVHPARMYWMAQNNGLEPILSQYEQTRRQDIPPAYYRNGSIYIVRTAALIEQNAVMAKPACGYAMGADYLLNIDEPRDWIIAEALMQEHLRGR